MIKCILVEDEAVAARRLTKMLTALNVEVIENFQSNSEFIDHLENETPPDIYFLDIHLNDGIVFNSLQKCKPRAPIIFTTAYDEYAIKAFKQNSIDYLLKPVDREELENAIEKFKKIHQTESKAIDLSVLQNLLQPSKPDYRSRFTTKVGDKLRSIKSNDIRLIESRNKITFLGIENSRSFPVDLSIENIYDELNPKLFHRVNRSQIVNIDFISEVIAYSNSRLKVKIEGFENSEIIVSRERVKAFKSWFG